MFLNVIKGNVGRLIAEEFVRFVESDHRSLISYHDVFSGNSIHESIRERVKNESHTRLYLSAKNILKSLEATILNDRNGAKYVIYFNPIIFLNLNLKQIESTIKHEILHIVSLHLIRAKEFKATYSTLAINMAMNIVVNTYLDYLPPDDSKDKTDAANDAATDRDLDCDRDQHETIETAYNPEKTHDIWEDSSDIDEKTLQEFTKNFTNNAQKGSLPNFLASMVSSLKNSKAELPWNLYLKRLMGAVESNNKKTITRRNRRQPDRLDLRGQLRSHKAKIVVALDISGSISDQEFNQAIQEVLDIG